MNRLNKWCCHGQAQRQWHKRTLGNSKPSQLFSSLPKGLFCSFCGSHKRKKVEVRVFLIAWEVTLTPGKAGFMILIWWSFDLFYMRLIFWQALLFRVDAPCEMQSLKPIQHLLLFLFTICPCSVRLILYCILTVPFHPVKSNKDLPTNILPGPNFYLTQKPGT